MISFFGPFPKPFGGVSVHLYRLSKILTKNEINHTIYDQYSKSIPEKNVRPYKGLFKEFVKPKPLKLHIHFFNLPLLLFFICALAVRRSDKYILTIHNERVLDKWYRRILFWILSKQSRLRVIFVSSKLFKIYSKYYCNSVCISAYISPTPSVEINKEPNSKFRVAANLWSFYGGCEREYGLDYLIQLACLYSDIEFTLFVGDSRSQSKANNWLSNAPSNIVLKFDKHLADELPNYQLFLRLNRTDAFGVSIQEAMDLEVPCLATNVCVRPAGALLCEPRNESVVDKFKFAIEQIKLGNSGELLKNSCQLNEHQKLLNLYKEFLNETSNTNT